MKTRFSWLVVLLLCLTLPLTALAEFGYVQLGTDLYEQADSASAVVSNYGAGTWVEILTGDDAAADDTFVNVTGPDGVSGFVPAESVFVLSKTTPEQVAVVANKGKYVNLRAKASKNAKVLAKIDSGTPMTLVETGKTFHHVLVGGVEGFMSNKLLTVGIAPIYARVVESANGKSVNLRSEPTMNGDILASIPYDGKVDVLMLGGGWAYVRYSGTEGYVMSKFLTNATPTPGPVPNPDPDSDFWEVNLTCFVSNHGSSVRYRSGPGGSAPTLGKLPSGTEVFVMSTNGSWSKIVLGAGDDPVYMMSKFLVTVMPDDDDPDIDDPVDPVEADNGDE